MYDPIFTQDRHDLRDRLDLLQDRHVERMVLNVDGTRNEMFDPTNHWHIVVWHLVDALNQEVGRVRHYLSWADKFEEAYGDENVGFGNIVQAATHLVAAEALATRLLQVGHIEVLPVI